MRKLWFDCVGQFRLVFGELGKHAKGKVAKGEGLLKSSRKRRVAKVAFANLIDYCVYAINFFFFLTS